MTKLTIKSCLLATIAFFLILGQLARFELTHQLIIYPHDLLVLIYLLFSLPQVSKDLNKKLALALPFFGWLGLTAFIKFIWFHQNIFLLHFLRMSIYSVFLALIPLELNKHNLKLKVFITNLPAFTTIVAAVMYIFSPDMRLLRILGWDDHYYRLIGPLLDPNFMGIIICVGIILTIKQLCANHQYRDQQLLHLVKLCFSSITLGLTFSRSSLLALGSSLLALIGLNFVNKQKLTQKILAQTFLITMIIIATLCFAPKPGGAGVNLARSYSVWSRAYYDKQWLNFNPNSITDWLIGPTVTPNNLPADTHARLPNNLLASIYAWSGPVGVMLFLALLIRLIKKYRRKIWLAACLCAILIFTQANSVTEPFVFLIIGLTLILTNKLGDEKIRQVN